MDVYQPQLVQAIRRKCPGSFACLVNLQPLEWRRASPGALLVNLPLVEKVESDRRGCQDKHADENVENDVRPAAADVGHVEIVVCSKAIRVHQVRCIFSLK